MSELTLTLKPGEEDRLLQGHPWIFREELASVEGEAAPGPARLRSASGQALGWGHYSPASKIAFRFLSKEGPPDAAFYRAKLEQALKKRERLFPGETAYRLCFGESDGLPGLVVDRYGDYLVVQLLSAGMDRAWPELQQVLIGLLQPSGILLRNDNDFRKLEGLTLEPVVSHGQVPPMVDITEEGIRYQVPLLEGQKTGWYFDQRQNRSFLKKYFKARRVADLHCYMGGFALTAARSGAKLVYGLDSSRRAVELARANAAINKLEDRVLFEQGDVQDFLSDLPTMPRQERPDFILLDPPNLAKGRDGQAAAERAYIRLAFKAVRALPPGGLLSYSTCARRITRTVLERILRAGAAQAKRDIKVLAWRGQSEDHPVHPAMPETEYLHLCLLEVLR